jgi:superfamily II DNA or RNA helicase
MIYNKCLGRLGYAIEISKFDPKLIKEIKQECTVVESVLPAYKEFKKPRTYYIYYISRDKNILYLPRYYGIDKLGPPSYMALPEGRDIYVSCQYQPLEFQKEAIGKLSEIFNPKHKLGNGGVLSLPCGYGKTFCAIWTICNLKKAGLIIVPTECIMDQWIEAINRFVPGAKVGKIQGSVVDVVDKDFVIAMLNSISIKNYDPKIFDNFGITVFDECHHLSTESFCKSLKKIRTKFTLGLSATVERSDGLESVFLKFLGPVFHSEKRKDRNKVIIKKINTYSTCDNYEVLKMSNGTKNTAGMTTAISCLESRNILLINILKELIGQYRTILVLSSRRPHLYHLNELLEEADIISPKTGKKITYGYYYGRKGTNRQKHKELLAESSKCDIVLGIDTIAKEGLDIPSLNTLVWATPPGISIQQPVGRILRKYHEDLNPMVIDIVDHTGNYPNHSKQRNKWYKEEKYIIHQSEIDLDQPTSKWINKLISYLNKEPSKKELKTAYFESDPESEPEPELDTDICMINLGTETKVKPKSKKIVKTKKRPPVDPLETCLIRKDKFVKPVKKTDPFKECLI